MKTPPKNIAASVSEKLREFTRSHGRDHQFTLVRYATERFLYRLSVSHHAHSFVLKGAMLYATWMAGSSRDLYRPTRDIDFLGFGDRSQDELKRMITEICETPVNDDALRFDTESISIEDIRGDQEYPGQRIQLISYLGNARINLQVDVGFGDVVTPQAIQIEFPTILEMPNPKIRAYTPESVVAEKLDAIVQLGMANSRMKDYYDLWKMPQSMTFDGTTLVNAIKNTFQRRKTQTPDRSPVGISDDFAADRSKQAQWNGFLNRTNIDTNHLLLYEVVKAVRQFADEPLLAAACESQFGKVWAPGGPWS